MLVKLIKRRLAKLSGKVPLRTVLIVPVVLQIVAAVAIVGYLSFTNGQRAVEELASQLMNKVSDRIEQQLQRYLENPQVINQINAEAIAQGQINLQDPNSLTRQFWKQRFLFDRVCGSAIFFGSTEGEFTGLGLRQRSIWLIGRAGKSTNNRYYSYTVDSLGNAAKLTETLESYDPRKRPWYQDAMRAREPVWSRVYPDFSQKSPKIALAQPVYDSQRRLRGVIGVDCLLSSVGEFLRRVELGQSGETFIIERDGTLVASSSDILPFDVQQLRQLYAKESSNALIRSTANHLQESFGNFHTIDRSQQLSFKLNGERQLVKITPFSEQFGLDWLIVVVVPESDFMEQIHANNQRTILLCLGALGLAIVIGILTARTVTRPILKLSAASQKIASGELNQQVDVEGSAELIVLADSFNRMSREIQQSRAQLEEYARSLEQKVRLRTQSLEQEIIQRQRTQEQLATALDAALAASRAKSAFLANMSHELRSPLNAILGFARLTIKSKDIALKHRENLAIITRSGEHLLDLINEILDLSKIEAGRMTFNPQNFDLHSLLDELESLFWLKAETKQLQLIFQIDPQVPRYIQTDPLKLRQVLINLLSNAIKFTHKGSVTLKVVMGNGSPPSIPPTRGEDNSQLPSFPGVRRERNSQLPITNYPLPITNYQLIFSVQDTGIGIAAEEFDSIFEAFVQTKAGQQAEGTGLGLPIARKFVQLMGGEMSVKSEVGSGSIFNFYISVNVVDNSEITPDISENRVIGLAPNQPQYRILLVDDKDYNRHLLLQLLQRVGFEVKEASNGLEAVEICQTFEPHLIWMDMRMPVMDGYEATKQIKATSKGKNTKIIALTASTVEEDRAIIIAAGCDDFLRKPFREMDIFNLMNKHIGVVYIYENESVKNANLGDNSDKPLTPEDLAVFPETWLNSLYQAAALADSEAAFRLIEQIRSERPRLAAALAKLVDNFDFEAIEILIENLFNNSSC
ncbi:MAG TPA: hybrid sensor histidine kinase/response regulator [Cyanobacteria bacterium UBA11369]|nr:hybrid sensor histidine kinase/response regulator [Cyanobacteria bacterium UBA11371]HBE32232.1 hybrid sensor histidine kinase/response regulator [Cyanobacteria bacterium UBA11368]HBE50823.1 hybrid sensor histidine kinase/response regulator [Cyanobacteria bacterium UBA11369]